MKGTTVYNAIDEQVGGSTVFNGFLKGCDVYLYPNSFSNAHNLYLVMGHEYGHALLFHSGFLLDEDHHFAISQWMYEQADLFGCLSYPIKDLANKYASIVFPSYTQSWIKTLLFKTYPLILSL